MTQQFTQETLEPQPHLTKSNPLSLKLSNVQSIVCTCTEYEETWICTYARLTPLKPLSEPTFQHSLKALTDFYPCHTLSESQNSLSLDVERKLLGLNKRYMSGLEGLSSVRIIIN